MAKHENVNHPAHYGGVNNPYEVIKIIEHYDLNFSLGNVLKYTLRAGKKHDDTEIEDLEKAVFYLNRHLENVKKEKPEDKYVDKAGNSLEYLRECHKTDKNNIDYIFNSTLFIMSKMNHKINKMWLSQKRLIIGLENDLDSVYFKSRQRGITTAMIAYYFHKAMDNPGTSIMITYPTFGYASNKCKELKKVFTAANWCGNTCHLGNGSSIYFETISSSNIKSILCGKRIDYLFMDDHIKDHEIKSMWNSLKFQKSLKNINISYTTDRDMFKKEMEDFDFNLLPASFIGKLLRDKNVIHNSSFFWKNEI